MKYIGPIKELLVPQGSFGRDPRAKVTEYVAFIIISIFILLGLYWATLFFFIFVQTGQLNNLSTTIATYSCLEAPSIAICPLSYSSIHENVVSAYIKGKIKVNLKLKSRGNTYIIERPKVRFCFWQNNAQHEIDQETIPCLCIDMWKQTFFGDNGEVLKSPLLFQRTSSENPPDSIYVLLHYANDDIEYQSSLLKTFSTLQMRRKSRKQETIIKPTQNERDYLGRYSTDSILKIGVYDSSMLQSRYKNPNNFEPSWFYSNLGRGINVSLRLTKSLVLDVEKFYFHLIKGYVSHQENEYEVVVSQGAMYSREPTSSINAFDHGSNSYSQFDMKIKLSFRDFSVLEVFRLSSATAIASFITVLIVCLSAFNKHFIYELLFPYYDDEKVEMTVTTFATIISFGYVRKQD
ncbi:uncharacterized protein CMU_024670 [Cryptosporidium muris RN66]|uniref:Uncharacterized protein n=1 Tax=Cryptosporidium muris (strain RN66) TaxID=441375 RepID=B6AAQ9_CRYMR|nr:uncharacterized protein CMU_024670 [Cryptosporidium muris RN66]EEA05461.1 hypothetical protein, conserved [Cryptosporidium muris RN66]|eukprot:XP_002139810.1 hypothetical protein [Cryptosporidium muris RN66]